MAWPPAFTLRFLPLLLLLLIDEPIDLARFYDLTYSLRCFKFVISEDCSRAGDLLAMPDLLSNFAWARVFYLSTSLLLAAAAAVPVPEAWATLSFRPYAILPSN